MTRFPTETLPMISYPNKIKPLFNCQTVFSHSILRKATVLLSITSRDMWSNCILCCFRSWSWTQRGTGTERRWTHWKQSCQMQVSKHFITGRRRGNVKVLSIVATQCETVVRCCRFQRRWRFALGTCSSNFPNQTQERWFREVRMTPSYLKVFGGFLLLNCCVDANVFLILEVKRSK